MKATPLLDNPYLFARVDWSTPHMHGQWRALARFAIEEDAREYAERIAKEEDCKTRVVVGGQVVTP